MARIVTHECQAVKILDTDGTPLTTATVRALGAGAGAEIELEDVDEPGALMDYFFGRGERLVVVELDGSTREGFLDTRWLSADRGWWVQLTRPISVVLIGDRSRLDGLDMPDALDTPEDEAERELTRGQPLRLGL